MTVGSVGVAIACRDLGGLCVAQYAELMPADHRADNRILAALPDEEWAAVLSHARLVPLDFGEVIVEVDRPLNSVYFPISGVISALTVTTDGGSIEGVLHGSEGVASIEVAFGIPIASWRLVVQAQGEAIAVPRRASNAGHVGRSGVERWGGATSQGSWDATAVGIRRSIRTSHEWSAPRGSRPGTWPARAARSRRGCERRRVRET